MLVWYQGVSMRIGADCIRVIGELAVAGVVDSTTSAGLPGFERCFGLPFPFDTPVPSDLDWNEQCMLLLGGLSRQSDQTAYSTNKTWSHYHPERVL